MLLTLTIPKELKRTAAIKCVLLQSYAKLHTETTAMCPDDMECHLEKVIFSR